MGDKGKKKEDEGVVLGVVSGGLLNEAKISFLDTTDVGFLAPNPFTSTELPSRSTISLLAFRKSAPKQGKHSGPQERPLKFLVSKLDSLGDQSPGSDSRSAETM